MILNAISHPSTCMFYAHRNCFLYWSFRPYDVAKWPYVSYAYKSDARTPLSAQVVQPCGKMVTDITLLYDLPSAQWNQRARHKFLIDALTKWRILISLALHLITWLMLIEIHITATLFATLMGSQQNSVALFSSLLLVLELFYSMCLSNNCMIYIFS